MRMAIATGMVRPMKGARKSSRQSLFSGASSVIWSVVRYSCTTRLRGLSEPEARMDSTLFASPILFFEARNRGVSGTKRR